MQKIQLAIPEPCHENWHNMTPTEQGRFCTSCAKEVIDFSMMTDTQVLNYFTDQVSEKVCGRALPSQLNRDITMPVEPRKKLFWYWHYFIMFFLFFSKSNFVKAQTKGKVVTVPGKWESCNQTVGTMVANIDKRFDNSMVSGSVVDENNKPIPFASIKISGRVAGVSADKNGLFSIATHKHDVIEITAAGYKAKELSINNQTHLTIRLERTDDGSKGEMVMVSGGIKRTTGKMIKVPDNNNHCSKEVVNVFVVKDHETGLPVKNAAIVLVKIGETKADTVFTDIHGVYKLKRLNKGDGFFINVSNERYKAYEFTLYGNEFNERKEAWEILLEKKNLVNVRSAVIPKSGTASTIILGNITKMTPTNELPLYVVDGIIVSTSKDINPNDILDLTVLQGQDASAIYGPKGAYGAIVMITKAKGMVQHKVNISPSHNKAPGHSLIYPNPVQRGHSFTIDLQVKKMGPHQIQISDLGGQIVFQKQIDVTTNGQKEMIPTISNGGAGIFFVAVLDNTNRLISKDSFIVE